MEKRNNINNGAWKVIKLQSYIFKLNGVDFRRFFVPLSVICIFCNYYYLYFFDFNQGVSLSPYYFSALKIVGIIFFTLAFFELRLNVRFFHSEIFLVIFILCSAAIFFVKRLLVESGSDLYFNTFLCALPFILFPLKRDSALFISFFEVCIWLLVFQVAADSYFNCKGLSLWDNGAFVGGFGNPSSFGLFCNIVLSYVVFLRKRSVTSLLFVFLIVYAIISSKSLFALFSMFFVVFYFIWSKSKFGSIFIIALLFPVLVFFADSIISGHLAYKLVSLYRVFFDSGSGESQSITLRIDIHKLFIDRISENFFQVFFLGYDNFYYYSSDSQFLTFFGSFGVFFSLIFFYSVLCCLVVNKKKDNMSRFLWVAIFLFLLMFFSNRVVDYYPMPILFFLFFFGSKRFQSSYR